MQKFFIIGILLCLIGHLSLAQSRKKAPNWMLKSPSDGLFYYGIGSSSIDEREDYRKIAREHATREIAEKLLVRISSTSSLQTKATDDSYSYLVNSDIQTQTINSFQDLRLEEDWLDPSNDTYYALYKLDVERYRESRKEYMGLVLDTFGKYMSESEEAFGLGHYNLWLRNLEEAMLTIKPDLNRLVGLDYRTRLKSAQFELEELLRRQLRVLRVASDEKDYRFDPLSGQATQIILSVQSPVSSFDGGEIPLMLKELKGDVFRSTISYTSAGMMLEVQGVLPEASEAVLQLYIDLPSGLKGLLDVEEYPLLETPVKITFEPFLISVSATEFVLGRAATSTYLDGFFTDFLSHCSILQVEEDQAPPFHLSIHSSIKEVNVSTSTPTKVVSFQLTFEVKDGVSDEVLLRKVQDNGRGFGSTYSKAVKNAYDHFVVSADPMLEELVEVLCSIDH